MSLSELGVLPSSVGAVVKSWEHWCVVLTLLLVLYLVWVLVYNNKPVNLPVPGFSREGLVDYTAGNLGFDSLTDAGNMINTNAAVNNYPMKMKSGFSVGGYEPPVYWPAADYELLDPYNGSVVQETAVELQESDPTVAGNAGIYQTARDANRHSGSIYTTLTGAAPTSMAAANAAAVNAARNMQGFARNRRDGFLGTTSSALFAAMNGK